MPAFNRVALIATVLLAGCTAPVTMMYAPCTGNEDCKIVGEKPAAGHLVFKINDEKVAEGRTDLWTHVGHVSGRWQGKPFDADCHQGGDGWDRWEACDIVIDGRPVGEMNFSK
ncbi:MAG TPA: hypothetical protein VMH34_06575 [Gammaproteobacteria bacterium]|nr:hypothetical protein [Gammaproteobacteria bacterium]